MFSAITEKMMKIVQKWKYRGCYKSGGTVCGLHARIVADAAVIFHDSYDSESCSW